MKKMLLSLMMFLALALGGAVSAQDTAVVVEMWLEEEADAGVPSGSILEVELLDVSRQDVPADVVSSQRYYATAFPARVSLPYDADEIDERMTYVISTKVTTGEDVLYRTTTSYPVLTRGAPDTVKVVMEQMMSAPAAPDLTGTKWEAFEIGGRMFVGQTPPALVFGENGTFGFFSGCNNFTGQIEMTATSIKFPEAMAGTRKMCPPPLDTLEQDLIEILGSASGYFYNGDMFVLTNDAGVSVLRFRRVN